MKITTSITGIAVLAALFAFLVTPAGAEDEAPAPAPAREVKRAPPGSQPMAHLARAADADHDGAVSAEEWKTFVDGLAKAFGELDKDGDGALAREEMPRPPRGPAMRGRRGPRDGARRGPPEGMRRGPQRGPDGQRGRRGGPEGFGERGPRPPDGETVRRGRGPRPPDGETVRHGRGPRPPDGETVRRGPGARGPGAGGPQDLGVKIDRLTAALEKLLERLESRPR